MLKFQAVVVLIAMTFSGGVLADVITMEFEGRPAGTLLLRDGTYTENGMEVTSHSDFSQIGDPLGWNDTGNALYFHGYGEYVEFKATDGSGFDLLSLSYLTNGYTESRWVRTSLDAITYLPSRSPGGYWESGPETIHFSGTGYEGIKWFQVGTPFNATEIDNVTVETSPSAVPLPSVAGGIFAALMCVFGLRGLRHRGARTCAGA
jgi:hypothetical protein